jgi:hypothetical protein
MFATCVLAKTFACANIGCFIEAAFRSDAISLPHQGVEKIPPHLAMIKLLSQ